jgi:hypothetical protein
VSVGWRSRWHTICVHSLPDWSVADFVTHNFLIFQDELTTLNVKHGFTTVPQLSDEFGTARNCNITASKVCGVRKKKRIFLLLLH